MPFFLNETLWFPPTHLASEDGLLAIGGDLSPARLVLAYSKGIFPWYSNNSPLLWWSPAPRCILPLDSFHISRRLQRRQTAFRCTMNHAFEDVIARCAEIPRRGQQGTWIVQDMIQAYITLHHLGFAHSVECWQEQNLVGGLYGIWLGKAFFGESMFHNVSDASKIALIHLVQELKKQNVLLLDCQQATSHLLRMGAQSVSRTIFETLLQRALQGEEYLQKK